jgi:preprotein translocase subunit SecG
MMTDPGIRVLIASLVLRASRNESGAPAGSNRAGLFEGMSDPYEWKSAVTVALIFFVLSLALAPVLTPDQKTLAAEINTKTLKAADAVKSSTR